jgi:hypothetical protein
MNLRATLKRLLNLFGRNDSDLDAELDAHLDLATMQNLHSGMSPQEARRQALIQLKQTKLRVRDQQILPWLDSVRKPRILSGVTVPLFATTSAGAITGIAAGLFSARYLSEIFYQVRPTDAPILALPAIAIIAAGSIAAFPATTLRAE